MADNRLNNLEYPLSDVGDELNISPSLNENIGRDSNSTNPTSSPEMKNVQDLTRYVELLLQQMQERFQAISDQVLSRIDDMGNRIDDLERNIADLVTQSGIEGPPNK